MSRPPAVRRGTVAPVRAVVPPRPVERVRVEQRREGGVPGNDADGAPDVEDLLRRIVAGAAGLTGARDGLVWLVEDEGARLVVRCGTGRFGADVGRAARAGAGLAGVVWERGEPLAVDGEPGEGDRPEERAAMAVPLRSASAPGRAGASAPPSWRWRRRSASWPARRSTTHCGRRPRTAGSSGRRPPRRGCAPTSCATAR